MNNSEYKVIDNAIPPSLFSKVERYLTDLNLQSWMFVPTTTGGTNDVNILNYSFAQWLFNDNQPASRYHEIAHDGILTALDNFGVQYSEYYRTRLNLFTAQSENIIHGVHIDRTHPHHSMIIYLNDSDGDTFLYEQHEPWMSNKLSVPKHEDLTVVERISPKRNRAILFCGNRFHSSSAPTKSPFRITLNTNFLLDGYEYNTKQKMHGLLKKEI